MMNYEIFKEVLKKKIKYSYIVIKKRAHLLVEILMKEGNIYVKDF